MGDEDRSRELPHRVRGATGTGPAAKSPPVLSEELRQRIHEAVRAERAVAVEPDRESTTESTLNGAAPVPADSDLTAPDVSHVDHASPAAKPKPPAEPQPNGSAPADHATEPRPDRSAPADHAPVTVPPPRRSASPRRKPVRRRFFTARTVMVAVTIIVAALIGSGLARYLAKTPPAPPAPPAPTLHGQEAAAAAWIAQQVSHSAVVSCDPTMCSALAAAGFPRHNLRVVGPTAPYPAPYPLTSAVVVVTPAVQGFYGNSLTSNWAPAVLAAFGSGNTRITVRVIAPKGAAAYRSELNADLTARKQIGNSLLGLGVNVIALSGTARAQLTAGQVDSRLMLAIAALATKESVDILKFGNIGPGGDLDMPLRYADLAANDPGAQSVGPAYVQSILTGLGTVPAAYRPARTATVVLPGGQTVLRIEFTAPTPLGPQRSP